MTSRVLGAAGALAILLATVAAAGAQTAAAGTVLLAQAQTGAAAEPARPSRSRAKAKSSREPTAGQMAARERQKKCGVEWKEAKAGGKTAGQKWPQFWSKCNARLKGNQA